MRRLSLMTFLAPLVVASSLNAASFDYLLEIDGIKGESGDSKHPDTIHIESFSWGASNPGASAGGGGGGAGKVVFQDLHFSTTVSKASPTLMLACATGQHIAKATIYVRKTGANGEPEEYLTITLEDALISSFSQTGRDPTSAATGDSLPTEEVSFYYNKVTLVYIADDGTQTTGRAVRTTTQ